MDGVDARPPYRATVEEKPVGGPVSGAARVTLTR